MKKKSGRSRSERSDLAVESRAASRDGSICRTGGPRRPAGSPCRPVRSASTMTRVTAGCRASASIQRTVVARIGSSRSTAWQTKTTSRAYSRHWGSSLPSRASRARISGLRLAGSGLGARAGPGLFRLSGPGSVFRDANPIAKPESLCQPPNRPCRAVPPQGRGGVEQPALDPTATWELDRRAIRRSSIVGRNPGSTPRKSYTVTNRGCGISAGVVEDQDQELLPRKMIEVRAEVMGSIDPPPGTRGELEARR